MIQGEYVVTLAAGSDVYLTLHVGGLKVTLSDSSDVFLVVTEAA